jgi:SAM-dependent methyltransferase
MSGLERLGCPKCHGPVAIGADPKSGARCEACNAEYPRLEEGFLDFSESIEQMSDGQIHMESPAVVRRYEQYRRPNFVRAMGENWDGSFRYEDEDRYLADHVHLANGPIVDVACGAGRWTRILAEQNGPDCVIGLDLSVPMLRVAGEAVPNVFFVRGNALRMPFRDGVLGGANCSNALQLIPDPAEMFRELGRCIGPGGTFTCFTYRRSASPTYQHFQERFAGAHGCKLFDVDEVSNSLDRAGFDVTDVSGPNLIFLFTARRRAC